jgi:general L-amino acid transport system permease protein
VIGVILATILGTVVGLARLSSNWLVNRLALTFIEIHRNIPLLVLLFLWYQAVFSQAARGAPEHRLARTCIPESARAVYDLAQADRYASAHSLSPLSWVSSWPQRGLPLLRRLRETSGKPTYYGAAGLAVLIAFPILGWFYGG